MCRVKEIGLYVAWAELLPPVARCYLVNNPMWKGQPSCVNLADVALPSLMNDRINLEETQSFNDLSIPSFANRAQMQDSRIL